MKNVRRAMRRARGAFLGTRSRGAAFLGDVASVRVSPRFRGLHWLTVVAIILLALEMFTGVLLSLYYFPEPDHAYESTRFLVGEINSGWLIRSFHYWAGELLVVTVIAHVAVTFLRRAYERPREYLWVLGVLLLFVVFLFRFTGRLLPWDTVGFASTMEALELMESVPGIGGLTAAWLRGGAEMGAKTLGRFFTTHVLILPWVVLLLLGGHLYLVRSHGMKGGEG